MTALVMSNKIIVDVFGADNSPSAIVRGAALALSDDLMRNNDTQLVLTGDKSIIQAELTALACPTDRIVIEHATGVVTNQDKPTEVSSTKKDTSLVRGLYMLREQEHAIGMVTAGSTGAALASGVRIIGRMQGVVRPTLTSTLPNVNGGRVYLSDCGANVDCKPEYLMQFGILATHYVRAMTSIAQPRVALVNNGVEAGKGNEVAKAAHTLLERADINFIGNLEARDALFDKADILVTDGFVGNILLKGVEGTALAMFGMLKQNILSAGIKGKLGAVLLKKAFKQLKNALDYQHVGGAPLLGLNKILVKAHGSSQASSICISILDIQRMHDANMMTNMQAALQ
jgi:glycerol-3-phosphate acyltransferase PlsX